MDNTRTNNSLNGPPKDMPDDEVIYDILCRISEKWRRRDGLPMVPEPWEKDAVPPSTPSNTESEKTVIISPRQPVLSRSTPPGNMARELEETVILGGGPIPNKENRSPVDSDEKTTAPKKATDTPPLWDDDGETVIIRPNDSDHAIIQDDTIIIHKSPDRESKMAETIHAQEDDDIVLETIVLGPGSYDIP